ncbi:methyltransferase domain-containing protein [Streptomyces mirabilis]|uniref:methyltransferase domain-containing protein n=1 Tax=Streptomyces mirabilis TaxID=68239 RepID=UPI00332E2D41
MSTTFLLSGVKGVAEVLARRSFAYGRGIGLLTGGSRPQEYERHAAPITSPFIELLLCSVQLPVAEAPLDVACGSGFAARAAARRLAGAGRVVGVDVNPGMLFIPKEASPGPRHRVAVCSGGGDLLPDFSHGPRGAAAVAPDTLRWMGEFAACFRAPWWGRRPPRPAAPPLAATAPAVADSVCGPGRPAETTSKGYPPTAALSQGSPTNCRPVSLAQQF